MPTKLRTETCIVHIQMPPGAAPQHLCVKHYVAWRDGEREGRAVVEAGQSCPEGCGVCRAEAAAKQ